MKKKKKWKITENIWKKKMKVTMKFKNDDGKQNDEQKYTKEAKEV